MSTEGQDARSAVPPRLPQAGQRLIALDPGRRDLVFGSVHNSTETVHMSTGQFCHENGTRWRRREAKKVFSKISWGDSTIDAIQQQLPSSKTSSLDAWEDYLDARLPLMQTLLDAWKKRCFRKSALWIYGKRDRCIDHLCKRITGGVPGTLVAFGGAASCSTGFGYAPAPQKRLRARLAKVHGVHVSIIRGRFTSQRCSIC